MTPLWEHQVEVASVAQQQNVLLSCPRAIGKTFLSALLLREHVAAIAHDPHHTNMCAVAVAASVAERQALRNELGRLCGFRVASLDGDIEQQKSDDEDATPNNIQQQPQARQPMDEKELLDAPIAVLSPQALQDLLRKQVLTMDRVKFLVIEGIEQIQTSAPSFYIVICREIEMLATTARPRIFATTQLPCSKLQLNSSVKTRNPLYAHIQVINMVPVLPSSALTPVIAPLFSEPFDENDTEFAAPSSVETLTVSVRDFLLGTNSKKVDLVRAFRMELEMGNSALIHDEKKKQDRVNRFIMDAESVYERLGLWCLFKFVELELQSNLQACVTDDPQNFNHQKKKQKQQERTVEPKEDELGEKNSVDSDFDDEAEEGEVEENSGTRGDLLSKLLTSSTDLDESTLTKVKPIIKVITWLASQANKVGIRSATPRLLKTSAVVQNRFINSGKVVKVWVFLERRCYCRVVGEYLSACLEELGLPPACCMLGNSNARVSGSLRFSSYRKVMGMFINGKTNVMVTTSIAKSSQKQQIEPPLCDLIVVMDELLEPAKLFDYCKRACPNTGVVKYIMQNKLVEFKKFDTIIRKMEEYVRLEEENNSGSLLDTSSMANSFHASHQPDALSSSNNTSSVNGTTSSASTGSSSRTLTSGTNVTGPTNTFETVNRDTGAVLNLTNSVQCLTKFCDTLPGLDTYDRRPQYMIKRHPISYGMSAATKQYKKKKLKYNAKLDDKIDDCKAEAEAKESATLERTSKDESTFADADEEAREKMAAGFSNDVARFHYSASLRLPLALGIKKHLASQKVETEAEAKGIVAYKACLELIKKGLLDRNFRSKLIDDQIASIHHDEQHQDANGCEASIVGNPMQDNTIIIDEDDNLNQQQKLEDLSIHNSYDLPPVSADELSLRTIRSLTKEAENSSTANGSVTMCFYGLSNLQLAILATNGLYTGNTNTGWRYDFATSDVMNPVINQVTLQKNPTKLTLTKEELYQVLHFHLVMMRLACMGGVEDALRDIDIVGENVWKEFSKQNDKGYLVVPSKLDETTQTLVLDWTYVQEIITQPLLVPIWPFPATSEYPVEEWICVPVDRRNVTYVTKCIAEQTVQNMKDKYLVDGETWDKDSKKEKSTPGNPILGRWYTLEQLVQADPQEPLIYAIQVPTIVPLIRRVMQRNHDEGSIAQYRTKNNERFLIPSYTSRLRLTKSRYFEAMGIVPLLYEFERKCQISHLMTKIGLEVDMTLLDDATTKPAYERLEILGDTYLKLETSWFMYESRKDIVQEGHLTQLRRDIIRNDRLNKFALDADLHHYILYPAEVEQHPFECWKPSCMGKTPQPIVAPSKWIADVLEAICGAYLVGKGEAGARYFLKWIGVSVLGDDFMFSRPYYPDCFPNELYTDDQLMIDVDAGVDHTLHFTSAFEDMPQRLLLLQQRLKYTFTNKRLLLEAVTHPSIGQALLDMDRMDDATRRTGNGNQTKKRMWKGDYERLEYLGDAIIEYLTLSYAFLTYDTWLPGSLSQWKSATVSNDALGKTALAWFGIDECICAGAVRIDRETMEMVARIERKYTPTANSRSIGGESLLQYQTTKNKIGNMNGGSSQSLPKMFADVFEALVAAVFLDSGMSLQRVRDVFLGPLLATVGKDAHAYVCRESGLVMDNISDELMEEMLISSDEDDED